MATKARALFVHEVIALGQEVANESTFNEG